MMSDTPDLNGNALGDGQPVLSQAAQMPPADGGRRRALLIGIDDYPRSPLSGCVADVTSMESVLRHHYEFHEIDKLLAPIRAAGAEETAAGEATTMPTRANLISAIRAIGQRSERGDFVYIHYSGHGTQLKTVYDKKGSTIDEALICFDGTYIRDIELGVLLDELAAKELSISVTLDCCHSGGALREDEVREGWKNRFLRTSDSEVRHEDWLGRVPDQLADKDERHSWFYGERNYHLLAACQPREYAWEKPNPSQGLFTSLLIQALEGLDDALQVVSYGTVLGEVRARCMDYSRGDQCPVLFGDKSRTFFSFFGVQKLDPFQGSAFVIRVNDDGSVALNSGSTDLVTAGDEYRIYQPKGTDTGVQVRVERVDSFTSDAHVWEGDVSQVRPGFRAKLSKRAAPAQVILLETEFQGLDFLQGLSAQCAAFFDEQNPLEFRIGTKDADADFYVRINREKQFEILGQNQEALPYIPAETANGTPQAARTLCNIVQHVRAYLAIANMAPSAPLRPEPQFQMTMSHEGLRGDEVATYSIDYNNSAPYPVWITALNLAPDWSISTLIWNTGSGQEVEARTSIETFTAGVTVPCAVKSSGARSMTERVRLFVSKEQHDFSNLTLEPLEVARRGGYRNIVPRPLAKTWGVCDMTYDVSW
ncbi:caspase domain-containing protein [Macrophomina phaseolina]|uniref:Caspase domain-containing protein n=1 Tax=Macrophomina phaseolina TaxID=35725 RepID=A0ABQ8FQ59_9PEZI|nr:caspase domain-containing protein [Macrophomina phaseolina]